MWAAEAEPFAEPDPEPAAPPAPETARDATPVVASMPIGLVLADAQPSFGWVAFASTTTGYRLFQFTGAIPGPGETIDVPELGERVVLRLGRSPLPHDQRTCVFLEQLVRAEPALAG